jgi:hypothetical protein
MSWLNVVAVAYVMLQLDVGRALECHLCIERSKKVPWLNGYNKQIFLPNLTEEF